MHTGYSFMGMQGDTYAAHQDLGKHPFSRSSANDIYTTHFFLSLRRWFG